MKSTYWVTKTIFVMEYACWYAVLTYILFTSSEVNYLLLLSVWL